MPPALLMGHLVPPLFGSTLLSLLEVGGHRHVEGLLRPGIEALVDLLELPSSSLQLLCHLLQLLLHLSVLLLQPLHQLILVVHLLVDLSYVVYK